jgi:Ca-activated chloride channel family protein
MDELIVAFDAFHFIRPWWLSGLALLIAVPLLHHSHSRDRTMDALVDPHLQAVVVDRPQKTSNSRSRYLPALVAGLLIISLAGPTWERLPQPLFQLQQGRVVVLSLAKSMDRNDVQPSRLERAIFKIDDLLVSMPGLQTGLIGFSGDAFVITPLSDDQDTISNLLHSLDSDTLPTQGIRADRGLEKARQLLSQVKLDVGEVILVTDQTSPLAVRMARALSNDSIRVSVLEISPEHDQSQQALLNSIAQAGRGIYTRISPGDLDIDTLNAPFKTWLSQANSQSSETQRKADQWRDAGPWLLMPVLLLASLMFRRGWLRQN